MNKKGQYTCIYGGVCVRVRTFVCSSVGGWVRACLCCARATVVVVAEHIIVKRRKSCLTATEAS